MTSNCDSHSGPVLRLQGNAGMPSQCRLARGAARKLLLGVAGTALWMAANCGGGNRFVPSDANDSSVGPVEPPDTSCPSGTGGALGAGGSAIDVREGGPAETGTGAADDAGPCSAPPSVLAAGRGLLIDDFEDPTRQDDSDLCLLKDSAHTARNLLGRATECFNNCGNDCPSASGGNIETSLSSRPEDTLRCAGRSLILKYDVSDRAGGYPRTDRFGGYIECLTGTETCDSCTTQCQDGGAPTCPGLDLDSLNVESLSFWIRFDTDSPDPDVELELKDVCGQLTTPKPRALAGGWVVQQWGDWSKVQIPIKILRRNAVNTRQLERIAFTFTQAQTATKGYAQSGRMFLDDLAFER
jgi:hypothetical protein